MSKEPDLYAGHGKRVTYTLADYVSCAPYSLRTLLSDIITTVVMFLQIPEIDYVVANLTTGDYGDLRSLGSIGGPTVCCNWYA